MSEQPPIYVDKTPFFGRVEEQKQFIAALQDVLTQPATETLPYIFLLYGDGGIGKTTLAKRFRDIAADRPFRGKFQTLWIDWEDERRQGYTALQVGRNNITPEAVFDAIHMVAVRNEWGAYFKAYQEALKLRDESEKKAAEALLTTDERDELVQIRGLGATAIAKIMRLGIPGIGETGEKLAQAFLNEGIKVGAEQAARLRGMIETRLRARLEPDQFKTYLNPVERLANALAAGLEQVAATIPLLLFLDTYEIVDRADTQLRLVIRAAGARVIWIVSGRNDLVRGRKFGAEYFKGYADDFARRLLTYNMRQLALEDIRRYFAARAPQRPLNEEETEAISRATRGIPLAVCEAADIWEKDAQLDEIVGDTTESTPRPQIVKKMTDRYLLHVVTEPDKHTLYALTLARGDVEVLRAMLFATDADKLDLDALLHRLERDYASVHADRARLHDEPTEFLQEYLRVEIRRRGEEIQTLNQRAVDALRERVKKIEADLPLIKERCENEDWVKVTLDIVYHLFWLDETETWHWFMPRFVEGLAYDRSLQQGLLEIATNWRDVLSATGKKRLKALSPSDNRSVEENEEVMLDELSQLDKKGWLKGDGEAERRAILDWQRGKLFCMRKKYVEALTSYDHAEHGLPEDGKNLKTQLGKALYDLAGEFMWPEKRDIAVYSAEAERILPKVVSWIPEMYDAWYRLGIVLYRVEKYQESVIAHQHAVDLAPEVPDYHNDLGASLRALGHYDEAINEYQKAIDLDSTFAWPHFNLGNLYYSLGRTDQSITEYQKALELGESFIEASANYNLGNVYRDLGRIKESIAAFQRAISLAPEDATLHNALGNVYRDLGRTEDALVEYQTAINLDSEIADLHVNLGYIYQRLGHFDKAIVEYQKAIDLDPKFPTPHNNLAHLYRDLRHIDEAIVEFQTAIDLDPKFAASYNGLGNVYSDLGRIDEAIVEYQKAIDLAPEFANPHNGLGYAYQGLGRSDEAIAAYQHAIELDPKYPYPHHGLGNVYQGLGRSDEAIAAYQRAIELDPKYPYPHHSLGNMYQELGRSDEAIAYYLRAIELAPKLVAARASLVACLRKLGRETQATEHEKIARELIGKENEYNRACFESICGNADKALALLKVALDKKQEPLAWARVDPDFESLRTDPRFMALVGAADEKPSADSSTG